MVFSMIAWSFRLAVVVSLFAAPVRAQERRALVVGTIGGASLGHADSEQGNAAIFGGAIGFHLTPRLVVEGDVHTAGVSHVFGRDHHDFTETTATGSLLFRSTPDGRAHFIAGGGAGLQRAHTDADDPPFRIDRTETIRLLHGRIGAEWDISSRIAIRAEGVMWFGEGLDWVLGARAGLGYRF
jgi:outer membrane protein with beta-barrel domain